ncbi:hypothetical protein [Crocosphaera sp. Alani8]|uniref:hypothetical protein n=1 Tax=Crocosphaera sp. Alani8 TaxID=3038952 RepID=UPI00313DDEC6
MNPDNKPNYTEKNPNSLSQYNKSEYEPIDAEIIAETSADSSELEENENTVNLTWYPTSAEEPNQAKEDDLLPVWLKQGLVCLSTPWGIGSLSLIVLTNFGLVGLQLWEMQPTPEESPTTTLDVDNTPSNLSIPRSLNIARKSPDEVILDGLSTVSLPSPPPVSPQQSATYTPVSSVPTQKVVNINPPPSLTNAILPPSLQPQTPTNYQLSTTPLKVPQQPKNPPVPSSIPVAEIPRPLPHSTVPSVVIEPPPPPINNQTVSEEEQIRQGIKQQLKMEENDQNNIPLGFNHKTRLEMQNGMNELPPQVLPQQIKHLEQLQEREVLDSETSQNDVDNSL